MPETLSVWSTTPAKIQRESSLQTVAVFPDGSVMWEEPEAVPPPLPYAGYELPPRKENQTGMQMHYQVQNQRVGFELGIYTRWVLAGGAIALLFAAFGMVLPRFNPSAATSDSLPQPDLKIPTLHQYSVSPTPAVLFPAL